MRLHRKNLAIHNVVKRLRVKYPKTVTGVVILLIGHLISGTGHQSLHDRAGAEFKQICQASYLKLVSQL